MPLTLPSKSDHGQVAPASSWPTNVIVPRQRPPPATWPVALNSSGPAEGMLVTPGVIENVPVGSAGVPAQVQTVLAPAVEAPPSPIASSAPVASVVPINFFIAASRRTY